MCSDNKNVGCSQDASDRRSIAVKGEIILNTMEMLELIEETEAEASKKLKRR